MRLNDNPASNDIYYVNQGMQINFRHPSDPSISFLEYHHLGLHEEEGLSEEDDEHVHIFDPYLFDSQFLRYNQVIDTDYIDYFVLYTCQESADFVYDERDIDY